MTYDELNQILGTDPFNENEEIDDAFFYFDALDVDQLHLSGNFVYELSEEGEATIILLTKRSMKHVTIPDVLDGHRVSAIGAYAFAKCRSLKSMTMSANIKYIEEDALMNCKFQTAGPIGSDCDYQFPWTSSIPCNAFAQLEHLRHVDLPNGITNIGDNAFMNCGLSGLLTLPNGITNIGDNAFMNCGLSGRLTLPHSLQSIGTKAFYGCANVEDVVFYGEICSVGSDAFADMHLRESHFYGSDELWMRMLQNPAIQDLPLAANLYKNDVIINRLKVLLPSSSGQWCHALTAFIESVGPEGSDCDLEFMQMEEIRENAFFGARKLKRVILPDSVRQLGACAFAGCFELEEITIPDSVCVIPKMCFFECFNLCNITLPKHLLRIEDRAFSTCIALKNIAFPDSLEYIDYLAFHGCESIEALELPESTTFIHQTAFYGTMNLKRLTCRMRKSENNFSPTMIERLEYLYAPALSPKYLANSFQALREYALRSAEGLEYNPEVARAYEELAIDVIRYKKPMWRKIDNCPELKAMLEQCAPELCTKIDINTHPDEIRDIVPALRTFAENLKKGVVYSDEIYAAYIRKLRQIPIAGKLSQVMLDSVDLTLLVIKYRKLSERFRRQLCERFGDEIANQRMRVGRRQTQQKKE